MTDTTNNQFITCPCCRQKISISVQIVPDSTPDEESNFSQAPLLEEIGPRMVRTKHPLILIEWVDKNEWKHNTSILKRLGFQWRSEGELSRWQR